MNRLWHSAVEVTSRFKRVMLVPNNLDGTRDLIRVNTKMSLFDASRAYNAKHPILPRRRGRRQPIETREAGCRATRTLRWASFAELGKMTPSEFQSQSGQYGAVPWCGQQV